MAHDTAGARPRRLATFFFAALLALTPLGPLVPPAGAQGDCTPVATPISPGESIVADLDPEDCPHPTDPDAVYDVFTFQATAGTEYRAGMGALPSSFLDPVLLVKDSSGAVVASDDDGGIDENARVHFTAPASGAYTIEATSSGFGIGPYELSLAAGPCPPAPAPLAPGQSIAGRLSDADCFGPTRPTMLYDPYAIAATAGTEYTVLLRTPADSDDEDDEGFHFDPYLVLRNPAGAVVAEDDESGNGWNARIRFTAEVTGAYTVEATSAFPTTGTYRIELASGACPRPATPIAVGQTLAGSLDELDCLGPAFPESPSDLFTFPASAGQQYRVTMAWDGTGDPINFVDPYLVLRNGSGAVLAENDDGAGFQNAAIVYTAPSSGALTIEATSTTAGTGGYMLTLQTVACPAAPTPIAVGQTLSGALEATDCFSDARPGSYSDRFAFAATAGLQYTINSAGPSDGSFLPLAILRDPSGAAVRNGFGQIVYTPAVSGTFTVEITSDSPGVTAAYTVGLLAASCPPAPAPFSESQPGSGAISDTDCSGPNGRYDRWSFQATADRMYKITVAGSGGMDPRIEIVGGLGYQPFCCGFGTRTLTYKPPTNGTVVVQVGSFNGNGGYAISLESYVCGSTNGTISVGQTVAGQIAETDCYSDFFAQNSPHYRDTYAFAATAGQAYVITMASSGFAPYFRLTSPSGGVVVEREDDFPGTVSYTYTAAVSGTHSVEVSSAHSRGVGGYTLSLAASEPCQSETSAISSGQTLPGALETNDCYNAAPQWAVGSHYDRFMVELQAGSRYTFHILSTEFRPALILRSPAGAIVANDYDFGWTGTGFPERTLTLVYTAPASGLYTLDASTGDAGDTGAYEVSVDSNEGCSDVATAISIPSTTAGELAPTDCDSQIRPNAYRDRYTFSGNAGEEVRILMEAFSVDPFLALFDPSGQTVATDDDGGVGDDARIVVTLPVTGTYTIEATCFQSNWTGSYTLRLEPNDGSVCTPDVNTISLYGNAFAALTGTECAATTRPGSFADLYHFEAEAGQRYIINLTGYEFDAYLAVLGASGDVLAEDDDGGGELNARIDFLAPATGTYTIEATSDTPDAVGNYVLAVYRGEAGTQCVPEVTPLTIGQTVAGELSYSDCYSEIHNGSFHDRYTFTAEQGRTYRVYMTATPVDGSPTLDPWLVLFFGDDGALVQGDDSDDGTNNAEIVFTAPETEVYTFEATTYGFEETGPYTVLVEEVAPETGERSARRGAGDGGCTTRTLKVEPGSKIANRLSASDCLAPERPSSYHNRYSFQALAGSSYTIRMTSNEIDSRLILVGPSGAVVAEDDNGNGKLDARIELTAPAAGLYTIVAASSRVTETGGYELAVEGRTEETIGIYVPASGAWFLKNSNAAGAADAAFTYGPGGAGWVEVSGDWDGDGRDTAGLYDPASGFFFLKNGNVPGAASLTFSFGVGGGGYAPVSGDWDGDGVDTVGLYHPASGFFFLRNANEAGPADLVFNFGAGGGAYAPVSGDWNGDGVDSVGIYSASTGAFFLRNANASGPADHTFFFGPAGAGWRAVAGDWNADGSDTVGLYDPANGAFFLRNQHAGGAADRTFFYGPPGARPLAGDWNGR